MTTQTEKQEIAALREQIARLEAEKEAARLAKIKPLTAKVSDRGALSIYGLQRFPVTLYVNQWERIFEHMSVIQAFMVTNKEHLARKDA